MTKRCSYFSTIFLEIFALVILTGCTKTLIPSQEGPAPKTDITFVIPIDVTIFSADAVLQISLLNSEQLEIYELTASCSIRREIQIGENGQQATKESVTCPEGVTFQEVKAEEFEVPIGDINGSIEIQSKTVKYGERYKLSISGKSTDNCNPTFTSAAGIASSSTITISDLEWARTLLLCITITVPAEVTPVSTP